MDPYYRMDEDYLPEEWRQYRPAAPYRPQSMRWYVIRLFEVAQAVQIEVGKYANERWRDQDLVSMVYYSSGDNPDHRKYVKEQFKMHFNHVKFFKGSTDPSQFIFEINVGKRRIRQRTTLKLNY